MEEGYVKEQIQCIFQLTIKQKNIDSLQCEIYNERRIEKYIYLYTNLSTNDIT